MEENPSHPLDPGSPECGATGVGKTLSSPGSRKKIKSSPSCAEKRAGSRGDDAAVPPGEEKGTNFCIVEEKKPLLSSALARTRGPVRGGPLAYTQGKGYSVCWGGGGWAGPTFFRGLTATHNQRRGGWGNIVGERGRFSRESSLPLKGGGGSICPKESSSKRGR